jgi:TRAP-type transport system periplasmic protein
MSGGSLSRRGLVALFLAVSLVAAPGAAKVAAGNTQVLKFALFIPRSPEFALEERKYNERLAELTGNQVQVRVYWGGMAGDEQDVVRKMRAGQIDGSPLGLDVLSQFARGCLVLQSPGLFRNYEQVDSVRAALTPAFSDESYGNGFKALVWGDIGRLRLFSKQPLKRITDLKTVRPWLYPASTMLKEFYKQIGATGVSLGLSEVYGGMQVGTIDTYWATSVLAAALQWHRTAKYVSAEDLGFLSGAVVLRRPAWDALSEAGKKGLSDVIQERAARAQQRIREEDENVSKRLVQRAHTGTRADDPAAWSAASTQLRRSLIGKVYTPALVERAEQMALQHADAEQL